MPLFDQRQQHISGIQYNLAGDLNFEAVRSNKEFAAELEKLLAEVIRASRIGALETELASNVEGRIKNAVIQVEMPEPDKRATLDYLEDAKALLDGITSATDLVTAMSRATEIVRRLFT